MKTTLQEDTILRAAEESLSWTAGAGSHLDFSSFAKMLGQHPLRDSVYALIILPLLTVLILVIYRLKYHPLSRFPGPITAKLTDWYTVYHIVTGDNHVNLYRLHQKYGRFVRHGPNRLSILDARAVKEIYGSYGYNAKLLKADYYTVVGHHFGALNLVSEDDPRKHSRKRRLLAQGLTTTAVKSMGRHFAKNVETLCETIDRHSLQSEKSVNAAQLANMFTFDAMADAVFGKSFNLLSSEANRWILKVLPDAVQFLHIMGHMPGLLMLDYLPFKSQMARDMDTFQKLSDSIAQDRIQKGKESQTSSKDVFSYLLNARDPVTGEAGMSHDELVAEAGVLMIAGSDTAALALTATLYQLALNEKVQQRLYTEIQDLTRSASQLLADPDLTSCKFLRACLNEAMRLTPAVGGVLPRLVLDPGLSIAGEFVPGGSIVGVPGYALHRDPDCFHDPLSYKPERWMTEKTGATGIDDIRDPEAVFMNFSTGPRGCVGKTFAYAELTLAIARIVTRFEFAVDEELHPVESANSDLATLDKFVSHPIKGPFIRFRARSSQAPGS